MDEIPCDVAKKMVLNYIDGEVEGMQRAYLRAHIKRCGHCHRRYRILRQVRELLKESLTEFKLPADLSQTIAEKLPDRYPLEGFDMASIRHLELASKEGVLTPERSALTRRQLLLRVGIFFAALAVLATIIVLPFVLWWFKPPKIDEKRLPPIHAVSPTEKAAAVTDDTSGVFQVPDEAYAIMYPNSQVLVEKATATDAFYALQKGSLLLDARNTGVQLHIKIGKGPTAAGAVDKRCVIDVFKAPVYISFRPDQVFPGKGTLTVRNFGGTVRVSGQTLEAGNQWKQFLDSTAIHAADAQVENVPEASNGFAKTLIPERQLPGLMTKVRRNDVPTLNALLEMADAAPQ